MRCLVALLAIVSVSCGGGGSSIPTGPSPVMAEVEFRYDATTALSGDRSLTCNGVARLFPSWWGFTHATMIPAGEARWAALFENVPVGRQSVRLVPPVGCEAPQLVANDVVLGSATDELVFAFTVHPDGSVTR